MESNSHVMAYDRPAALNEMLTAAGRFYFSWGFIEVFRSINALLQLEKEETNHAKKIQS